MSAVIDGVSHYSTTQFRDHNDEVSVEVCLCVGIWRNLVWYHYGIYTIYSLIPH